MTPHDRVLITSPAAKERRRHLAALLPVVSPQLAVLTEHAPSYVVAAVSALMDAFDQWTKDEEATCAKSH